eukprot:1872916-Pyramimonas_sp.AAC.1
MFASAKSLSWGSLARPAAAGDHTIHMKVAPGWQVRNRFHIFRGLAFRVQGSKSSVAAKER